MDDKRKYYGKYRGTVTNNVDPEQLGRITAIVPAVSDMMETSWITPCVPVAGKQQGIFIIPQIGANVWIEFEEGDPDKPIWVGGFWSSPLEVPKTALVPPPIPPGQNILLETTMQNMLLISDAAPTSLTGGIILKSTTGAMIVVNDSGIYIRDGKGASINMVGGIVSINEGALMVI